jgi:hypothetical protein
MATLIFKLRHVPEDEAEEVRNLFAEHDIETYETSAGNWKISMPAIWLKHDDQLAQAKALLDEYQKKRYQRARIEFESAQSRGETQTFWKNFLDDPFRVTFYLGLIVLVLYLSLQLFLSLL